MKLLRIFIAISICFVYSLALANNQFLDDEPLLSIDSKKDVPEIRKFRSSDSLAKTKHLNISGSAQPSATAMKSIINKYKDNYKNVFIVDLRQESHGFINGHSISWYGLRSQIDLNSPISTDDKFLIDDNLTVKDQQYSLQLKRNDLNSAKTPTQITNDELELFSEIAKQKQTYLHEFIKNENAKIIKVNSIHTEVESIESEQELVNKLGGEYKRILVLDHHKPDDLQVDEFVNFIRTLPDNSWLHFHCRGGKGRATMFNRISNSRSRPPLFETKPC